MPAINFIRYTSDIHLERDVACSKKPAISQLWQPIELNEDHQSVLILAGDIWNGIRPLRFDNQSWLGEIARRFVAVVIVLGNHDYWGDRIRRLPEKWRETISRQGLSNVHLLDLEASPEAGVAIVGNWAFVGGTAWTDMGKNPLAAFDFDQSKGGDGRYQWNDRNFIRNQQLHRFSAKDWLGEHQRFRENLRLVMLRQDVADRNVALVTHHAPCTLSAPQRGSRDTSNLLYAADLSGALLEYPNIRLAIHGHVHESLDYPMGDIRVLCNPRGYKDEPNPDFDPVARIELDCV